MAKRYIKTYKALTLAFHLLMPGEKLPSWCILTVITTIFKNTFDLPSNRNKNNGKILKYGYYSRVFTPCYRFTKL